MKAMSARIGFVSTRLAGTDGVSLEVAKWVAVLERLGHECFFFAGEIDWQAERSMLVPEAHFAYPEVVAINDDLFGDKTRSPETSRRVAALTALLNDRLIEFVTRFRLDLLIAQNALSLPMNVPLGLALTELIAETAIPTIGHHHDFTWERSRFAVNAAHDYLDAAFPPTFPSVRHVVINSFAAQQLAMREGVGGTLVPNVMPFNQTPPPSDDYGAGLRASLGIPDGDYLLLQPTRIVPRKRIELAIELARRLDLPCTLLISHQAGDEGIGYAAHLREYAALLGVRVIFGSEQVNHTRGYTADGRPIYSLADCYQQCDLVTYPSLVEGFGNAFLETLYYRKPIVMSTYEIFKADIQPKGFKVIAFDEYLTDDVVVQARELLTNPALVSAIVEHNYRFASCYYSYEALETHLVSLLNDALGM